jgi:hypothetical protein
MKQFFTLLFLLICLANLSQSQENGSHEILIQNLNTSKLTRISENSNISIWTNTGKNISGRVRLIRADTIFFKDTLIRISNIERLYFKSALPTPHQGLDDERRLGYVAGWPNWRIICPPDSAYRDDWAWENYLHDLTKKEKEKRLEKLQPFIYKNFLKVNIAKLWHVELALSYERFLNKKISWETEISGIIGIPIDDYTLINYPLYNYTGFSVTTYPKFYYNTRGYVALVFMYRNLWFKDQQFAWPDVVDNIHLQDQYRNDFGLSLRFGAMKRFGRFVIDYYFGGGFKFVMLKQNIYGRYDDYDDKIIWNYPDHSAYVTYTDRVGIVINIGIKIGGAF